MLNTRNQACAVEQVSGQFIAPQSRIDRIVDNEIDNFSVIIFNYERIILAEGRVLDQLRFVDQYSCINHGKRQRKDVNTKSAKFIIEIDDE